tara:strand:- start:3143 stop:3883 length:741 start_codon:yes stop_codon:yes gene_type:complete
MSVFSRIYNLVQFKKFKKLKKVNYFFRRIGASAYFQEYIREKSVGLNLKFTHYSFSPHNPLTCGPLSVRWICESYHAAFDYIEKRNSIESLLEIGCGYGLSTWFLRDSVKGKTLGLDINPEAIKVAKYLFDDVDYVCSDYKNFFKQNPKVFFDIIIISRGPVKSDYIKIILQHCNQLIFIGYRTRSLKSFLFWEHKYKGKHLSFSTTVCSKKNKNSISLSYIKYFFTWHYLQSFIHSVQNRYYPPL